MEGSTSSTATPKYPRGHRFVKYNLLSRLYFCWVDPLLWFGARNTLQHEDLYAHPPEADSKYLLHKFNKYWKTELKYHSNGGTPRMWRAIFKCLWWRFFAHGTLSFLLAILLVGQSLILGSLTEYFTLASPSASDTRNAYLLAMGMALISLSLVTNNSTNAYIGMKLGMLVRVLCTSAVYQKILSLSQNTIGKLTTGQIVNLASNDVHRFDQALLFYHFFWVGPVHLGLVTYFIYQEIGPTSFLATILVVLQIPLQVALAKMFIKLRLRAASKTDERVKIMNEVLVGIRVIKMYGWEHAFQRMINFLRKKEVSIILKGSVIRAINLSYYVLALPTIMFTIFSVYGYIEGVDSLTPKKVFTTLSLLTFVRLTSVNFLLKGIIQVAEGKVAIKRITNFLLHDDLKTQKLDDSGVHFVSTSSEATSANELVGVSNGMFLSNESPCKPHVTATGVCASWSNDPDKLVLKDISLSVDKDCPLLAIVGAVGSGKSSLLQCLLGELPSTSGSFSVEGRVAYAAQEPWIFSSSLRDNILFGKPYEPDWYSTVVDVCALEKDIEILPQGDLTLIGERGVNLSGGQKARVSLARAVYSRADVYLLDDPLSAVDAAVSRHIFDRCIRGLLSESSVVLLVTHQLQYVQQCDTVLGLNEGQVTVSGDPADILTSGFAFVDLLGDQEEEEEKKDLLQDDPWNQFAVRKHSLVPSTLEQGSAEKHLPSTQVQFTKMQELLEEDEDVGDGDFDDDPAVDTFSAYSAPSLSPSTQRHHKESSTETRKSAATQGQVNKEERTKGMQLPAEDRAQGKIGFKTYYNYFVAGGGHIFTAFVFLMFFVGEASVVSADWWLSDWADCSSEVTSNRPSCNSTLEYRVGIYGSLVGSIWLLCIGRTVLFYVLALRAARILHDRMFISVLRSPILFFDSNPAGRILNRFSKDVGFLDDILIFAFCEFIQLFVRFIAIMTTAVVANPYLLIVVFVLMFVFFFLRWYYLQTAREVKRLEAVARSPLYSHISMTIHGLPTIRAYCRQGQSIDQFHTYHNKHTQGWDAYLTTSRWFGVRIDAISSFFVSCVAFISIPLAGSLNAGLVGLALTYAISLNGMFQYCIRQSAEVENYMVSAERVLAYGKLKSEGSLETHPPESKPHPDWPDKGHIEINDLSYRHSPETPLVLRGITCTIQAREKIGIIGRTGAGKSSLIASFFHLAKPQGSIKIDGVECLNIGLHDLRPNISIIPQDPVLFSGTIRYNLDPFNKYDDERIWAALKQVQLGSVVESLNEGLESPVLEAGSNFSVGQRQLFCLARALLKSNKVLMLDEATANVDLETDAVIQQVIRDQFSECTVLTIAHRLDTVMDSDKIMVLRTGELLEYGEPHKLLSNPESYLLRLVEHTGSVAAEKLKNMAQSAYDSKRTRKNDLSIVRCYY